MVDKGKKQDDALDGLGAGLKRITSDVAALRIHVEDGVPNQPVLAKLDELLAVIAKLSDDASERSAVTEKAANYAHRTAQMSAELGKRVVSMQTVLDSHTKILQVIKDKKGLVF